jgi:Type II secretion system (T2SS), protein M subtype b
MTLLRRIVAEHRVYVVPLALILGANLVAYALVVYPLAVKSATAESRAASASAALRTAQADEAGAKARVASKARAEQEIGIFYDKVLPGNYAAARRLTYAIPELAQKANVRFQEHHLADDTTQDRSRPSSVARLKVRVVLEGEYENLRRFIYSLETAPSFVIVDSVTLAQLEANKPLNLTLELSIYYRTETHGA